MPSPRRFAIVLGQGCKSRPGKVGELVPGWLSAEVGGIGVRLANAGCGDGVVGVGGNGGAEVANEEAVGLCRSCDHRSERGQAETGYVDGRVKTESLSFHDRVWSRRPSVVSGGGPRLPPLLGQGYGDG